MKINISLSMHHEKDKDLIQALDQEENVSGYIRDAIRFYIANNNGVEDYSDLRAMMETLLKKMEMLSQNGINYIPNNSSNDNPDSPAPIDQQTRVSGVQKIGGKINSHTVKTKEASVEEGNEELTEIGNAIDEFGVV